ncbi:MAG TPA: hypothetical protein VIG32_07195 [Candidatus Baltobacteraceae bacterium]|jgi:hypothetical protein
MIPADLAYALLLNRTAVAYQTTAPAYIVYRERTHVTAPTLGRAQDIDRSVKVRVADDVAVMQDLPAGGERTGQAFPIIPYFDPLSQGFTFSYFANLKRVDITLERKDVGYYAIPARDPTVNAVVPYISTLYVRYAPDSTDARLHFIATPTPRASSGFYAADVTEDPQTKLVAHVEMRTTGGDETIALDYHVLDGHWVITHGTFGSAEHVFGLNFNVVADVTYDQFAFPAIAPDPRLAPTH